MMYFLKNVYVCSVGHAVRHSGLYWMHQYISKVVEEYSKGYVWHKMQLYNQFQH